MRIGQGRAKKLWEGESLNGHAFDLFWHQGFIKEVACEVCGMYLQVVKIGKKYFVDEVDNNGDIFISICDPHHTKHSEMLTSCETKTMHKALK